jgi:ABC-type branched-subunit amino acid transport system ATPase component
MALRAEGLTRYFGGVAAVRDVSLGLQSGEIVALIGPNGAGKSTAFDLLSGVTRPDAGRVTLFGQDVTGWPPHRIARLGLTRTFQVARGLERLTVLENLLLAVPDRSPERLRNVLLRPGAVRRAEAVHAAQALAILEEVGLAGRENHLASELSGGQRKLLELGRALASGARLVLLDEVGAGVAPALRGALCDTILHLRESRGCGFLLVEHDMGVVARLADRVIVMAAGQVLIEGPFEAVRRDPRVIAAYLGGAADRAA